MEQPSQLGVEIREQLQEEELRQVFCSVPTKKRKKIKYMATEGTEAKNVLITSGGWCKCSAKGEYQVLHNRDNMWEMSLSGGERERQGCLVQRLSSG